MTSPPNIRTKEDALEIIKYFRVADLQAVLEFCRVSKQGNKGYLFERCKNLIFTQSSPQLLNKIQQVNLARINSRANHYAHNYSVLTSVGNQQSRPPILQQPRPTSFDNLPAPNLVQNIQLPFYDRLRTIECINIPVDWNSFSPLRFILNDFDIDFILKGIARVLIRISPTVIPGKQDDVSPPCLFAQCNNHAVINNNVVGMHGSLPHAIAFPTDITDKLILKSNVPNTINYFWIHSPLLLRFKNLPASYTLKIQIVRRVQMEFLLDKILQREPQLTLNDHHNDPEIEDVGLMATQQRVSLICPITQALIKLPARSSYCTHLTCFDLKSFLLMNERRLQWKCPLCNKSASYENLCIDKRLLSILSNVPPNCSTVEIDSSSKNLSNCNYIIDDVKQEKSSDDSDSSSDEDDDESNCDSPNKYCFNSEISDSITVSSGTESRYSDESSEQSLPSANSSMPMTPQSINVPNHIDERQQTMNTNQSSMNAHALGSNVNDKTYGNDPTKLANVTVSGNNENNQSNSSRKRSHDSPVNEYDSHRRKRTKCSSSNKLNPCDIEVIVLSSDSSDCDDHLP